MPEFGTDIDCVIDIAPTPVLASGTRNLGNALARRLITSQGTLSYDASYGFNVRDLLNAAFTPAFQARARAQIERECLKDERVLGCTANVELNTQTQTLTVMILVQTADGPFSFVMSVNAVTVTSLQAVT